MKTFYKAWLSVLAMVSITACNTMPYYSQPSTPKRTPKAPVVDRTARRPPPQPYPPPQASVEPIPQEDPLLPREYASADPAMTDAYEPLAPVPTYASPDNGLEPQPYPTQPEPSYRQPNPTPYAGAEYRPPSYPPGAAAPATRRPNTTAPGALPEPQMAVVPPAAPTIKPPTAPPMPPAPNSPAPAVTAGAPAPVPAAPTGAPAPANATVAMTTPPTVSTPEPVPAPVPVARPPRPAAPATPPADLPPAEISREGNQAVVALLESADKYVKSKQLDKAGAALERALRIEPRNAGIWHDLAQIRLHQGQYQQAESLATKSNNLASDNRALQARNWKLIGSSRKAAGNRAGAEEAEAHAVQLAH